MKRVRERRAEYLARAEADAERPAERGERERSGRKLGEAVSTGLDALFAPAARHVRERKEWVAVAKMDDRKSGAGPGGLDLEAGVAELPRGEEQED